jgi:glycosyltransferase involved in cell wall biosynthesis
VKLSIVSPVYKASNILPILLERIVYVCNQNEYEFEIILIDDASPDDSWNQIIALSKLYPQLKGYKLSRNFGQHYAVTAGIHNSHGDYIVIMDCDLQDNPEYIPVFVNKALEGYNVVCSIKNNKEYSLFRKLTSDLYFFIINQLSDVKLEKNLGTMTLIDRKVAVAFLRVKEYHRHSSMIFSWLGFNRSYIRIIHDARYSGKSSYSIQKLVSHAVNGIISQSNKLLKFSISIGLFLFGLSVIGSVYVVIRSFSTNFLPGWPSLSVLVLFTSGVILLMIGILGVYLGKVFEQVKERPLYFISEETESQQ